MFYKKKITANSVQDGGGGSFISKSGIYDVILKTVSVATNAHNARSLNFNVEYQGSMQTFYGLKLDNNDGSTNFQAAIFEKLCVVTGNADDEGNIAISDPEIQTHKLGKDQVPTDLSVLDDFTDIPVKIQIQNVYSRYNGEIKENREIKSFFSEAGGSASEIMNKAPLGEQLKKDADYALKDAYRDSRKGAGDAPTVDEVDAWKAAKSGKTPKTTPKANPGAAANAFAQPNTTFPSNN